MQATEAAVDKSDWGAGPWQHEPDRLEWEHAGLPCLATRGPCGHWCGYAAVLPGHPFHGKSYDDPNVVVHGGLTYADKCGGSVCHVPKPGEPDDVWWFGFDCAHSGDYAPMLGRYRNRGQKSYDHAAAVAADDWNIEQYRTLDYVRAQASALAEQLAALHEPTTR
jgi:hypothetical protein